MEGYIFKFINFFEGWKPRYAIVKDYKLEMGFKKDEPTKKVYSIINLKVVPKDKCEFILDLGSKKLQLKAYTEIERNGWVNYIKDKQLQYTLEGQLKNSNEKNLQINGYSELGVESDMRKPRKESANYYECSVQDSLLNIQKYILSMNGMLSNFHEYIYDGRSQDVELLKIYEQFILLRSNLNNSFEELANALPSDNEEKEDRNEDMEMQEKLRNSLHPINETPIKFEEVEKKRLGEAELKSKIYTPIKLSRLNSCNLLRTEILSRLFQYIISQPFELNSIVYDPRTSLNVSLKYRDDLPSIIIANVSNNDPFRYCVPLTNLQREVEPLQYYNLLDIAEQQKSSLMKMAYVCAYIVAEASINLNRILGPVESQMGETFQFVDNKLGFRAFAEQVSESISALTVESDRIFIFGNVSQSQTFSMLKGAIETKYSCQRNLLFIDRKLSKVNNHYILKRPNLLIKNIIFGNPQADLIGIVELKELNSKDCSAELKFVEGNSKQQSLVEGKIYGAKGDLEYQIRGSWKDEINLWDASGANQIANLWRIDITNKLSSSNSEGRYSITNYGYNLNYLPEVLKSSIISTDSRFNVTIRLLESNDIEEYKRLSSDSVASHKEFFIPKYFMSDNSDSELPVLYYPIVDFYRAKAFD